VKRRKVRLMSPRLAAAGRRRGGDEVASPFPVTVSSQAKIGAAARDAAQALVFGGVGKQRVNLGGSQCALARLKDRMCDSGLDGFLLGALARPDRRPFAHHATAL